ncbi:MAG: PH domain-containing protein [Anaerolineales bacterium]
MVDQPAFLQESRSVQALLGRHKPVQSGRKGEGLAWLAAFGAGLGGALLAWRTGEWSGLALGALLLFTSLALIITFGNWMERNTALEVESEGIRYRSPLRKVRLSWDEITELGLSKSNDGWRVEVEGESGRFHYQTAGSLQFAGFEEMPLGIPEGGAIAALIKQRSGLHQCGSKRGQWVCHRGSS